MGRRPGFKAEEGNVADSRKKMSQERNTPSSENAMFLKCMMELRSFPEIDLNNPTEIEMTINHYLAVIAEYEIGPAMVSLAIAMHTTSDTLSHMKSGAMYRNRETMQLLTDFKQIVEAYLREGVVKSKVPAGYIFLLKARFGYQEVNRIQIEERQSAIIDDPASIKALEQKYLSSIVVDTPDGKQIEIAKPVPEAIDEVESTAVVVEEKSDAN